MRGKEQRGHQGGRRPGITPAYAGKRIPTSRQIVLNRDHPRVCGEKRAPGGRRGNCVGSPPRMRGKGPVDRDGGRDLGITPAYAGKRTTRPRRRAATWDHPRVCGEKYQQMCQTETAQGSPPRMRGKAEPVWATIPWSRITPAYAGKSRLPKRELSAAGDHPRVCGEKTQKALKYKRSFFQVLIFHLTSDRSQVSAHSLSVLDGSQSHPVPNKRILPQGNNCSVRQVSVGPASGYL